jgi:hypothetical protein
MSPPEDVIGLGATMLRWGLPFLVMAGCSEDYGAEAMAPPSGHVRELVAYTEAIFGGDAAVGGSAFASVGTAQINENVIAIPERRDQHIRIFSHAGEHLQTLGREGEGPGEYMGLQSAVILPDGAVAGWDDRRRMLTVHREGHGPIPSRVTGPTPGRVPLLLGVADGPTFYFSLEAEMRMLRGRPAGVWSDTVPLVRARLGGIPPDTFRLEPAPPKEYFDLGAMWGSASHLFDSGLHATVAGGYLFVSDGVLLAVYSADGTRSVHPIQIDARRPGPEDVTRERERRISRLGTSAVRVAGVDGLADAHRAVIREIAVASPLPRIDDMAPSGDGAVWVRQLLLSEDDDSTWFRVLPDGRLDAKVTIPAAERIESALRGRAVLRGHDEFGSIVFRVVGFVDANDEDG